MDLNQLFVAELLLLPPLMIALAGVLTGRAWKNGSLRDRLAYMVFAPKRRNRVMISFFAMTACYWAAGIVGALGTLGTISEGMTGIVSAVTFLTGSIAFMVMSVIAFAAPEPNADRHLLSDQPEAVGYSLGVMDRTLRR